MVAVSTGIPSLSLLCTALAVALFTDIRSQKIPNWLTFTTILLALSQHVLYNGIQGLFFSLKGLGVGAAVPLVFYAAGKMGAGDVKLLGAVGAVLGPVGALNALLWTAVAGGIYALAVFSFRSSARTGLLRRYLLMLRVFITTRELTYIPPPKDQESVKLCYGIAIATGTLGYVFWDMIGRALLFS